MMVASWNTLLDRCALGSGQRPVVCRYVPGPDDDEVNHRALSIGPSRSARSFSRDLRTQPEKTPNRLARRVFTTAEYRSSNILAEHQRGVGSHERQLSLWNRPL